MRLALGFRLLALVALVTSAVSGCQDNDLPMEPVNPPACATSLEVVEWVQGTYSAYLELSLENGWSDDVSIDWDVSGPGPGEIVELGVSSGPVRVQLNGTGPGSYTVTAALTDAEGSPCDSTGVARTTVVFESTLAECGMVLKRLDTPVLNTPVEFSLELGAGWDDSTSATWRVTGPADASLAVLDSVGAVRRARVTFTFGGLYDVTAEMAASADAKCAADSTSIDVAVPSGDPDCIAALLAIDTAVVGERTNYLFMVSASWGEGATVEWFFDGPAPVTTFPREHPFAYLQSIDVVFARPGEYTVGAVVHADEASPCGAYEESITVTVGPGDCGVTTSSLTRTYVGSPIGFTASPRDGWAFDYANARVVVHWTLVSGDPAGAIVLRDEDNYVSSEFLVRFDLAGTYVIEAILDDVDVGDGFACPQWVERFEIEVVGPPTEPLPLGLVSLASPATGPLTPVGRERMAVIFGTSAAVVVPTERGTDAVDLVTGAPLDAMQHLAPSSVSDPPTHSAILDEGQFHVALYESARTGGGFFLWSVEAWATSRRDRSFLIDVRDIDVPQREPWSAVLGRRADGIPCFTAHRDGIVTTDHGEAVELYTVNCNGDTFASTHTRFDVLQTEDPGATLVSSARFGADGTAILAVTDGAPGRVYVAEGANALIAYRDLGSVGNAPRMVRTYGAIGVVANQGSDDVTIVLGDFGGGAIVGGSPVGPGPTSVAVRERPGGGAVALTTSGVEATVTFIVMDAAGQVVTSSEQALPAGWTGELHGIWMPDDDMTFVVSCVGRSELFVGRFD